MGDPGLPMGDISRHGLQNEDRVVTHVLIGRGQTGASVDTAGLVDEKMLCCVGAKVVRPAINTKGQFELRFTIHPADKFLAMPMADIIGAYVTITIHAAAEEDNAVDDYAGDILNPVAPVDTAAKTKRSTEARARVASKRYLRGVHDMVARDDSEPAWPNIDAADGYVDHHAAP